MSDEPFDRLVKANRFLTAEWYRLRLEVRQLHAACRRKAQTIKRLRTTAERHIVVAPEAQATIKPMPRTVGLYLSLPWSYKCPKCEKVSLLTKEEVMTGEDIPCPCGCPDSWIIQWGQS